MDVLDLFSGVGGFSLGLERVGMRTVAFCECDPYCRAVLQEHWPSVAVFDDVRKLNGRDVLADVDVICGGFPCQGISIAGTGAGIDGDGFGLWQEFTRIIGELRPRYVIVENVSVLLGRGIDRLLGDLAVLGFNAEWHRISAAAVAAAQRRDRVWIVAYANDCEWRPLRNALRRCKGDHSLSPGQESEAANVAHGISARMGRIVRALGNAVVVEIIGRAIMQHDRALRVEQYDGS